MKRKDHGIILRASKTLHEMEFDTYFLLEDGIRKGKLLPKNDESKYIIRVIKEVVEKYDTLHYNLNVAMMSAGCPSVDKRKEFYKEYQHGKVMTHILEGCSLMMDTEVLPTNVQP